MAAIRDRSRGASACARASAENDARATGEIVCVRGITMVWDERQ